MAEYQEAFQSVSGGISAKLTEHLDTFSQFRSTDSVFTVRLRCVGITDTSLVYANKLFEQNFYDQRNIAED